MINGLLTLRGAWDKVRRDPVLKMFVVGITAYGMSTFEGPMLSFKTVNAISHFTDWTIGHVHIGALGWNGMLIFGMIYWLVPRLYNTQLYSTKLANVHFWIATLAIVFYAVPLYIGGITQALMWKQFTPDGFLKYPNFLETVAQLIPMYTIRAFGGALYVTGFLILVFNVVKTIQAGSFVAEEEAQAPALHAEPDTKTPMETWHRFLERKPIRFLIFATIAILIGGVVEVIPTYLIKSNIPTITSVKPYTPLELQGRDILRKRRLLQLPFADDPAIPFRNRTVWRIFQSRRIGLRSPRSSLARNAPGPIWPAKGLKLVKFTSPTPGITTTLSIRKS